MAVTLSGSELKRRGSGSSGPVTYAGDCLSVWWLLICSSCCAYFYACGTRTKVKRSTHVWNWFINIFFNQELSLSVFLNRGKKCCNTLPTYPWTTSSLLLSSGNLFHCSLALYHHWTKVWDDVRQSRDGNQKDTAKRLSAKLGKRATGYTVWDHKYTHAHTTKMFLILI